jgi:protein-disulfide isomerase
MKKALLLGTTGIAVALAMLAFGLAGSPNAAHAETAATTALDKKQVETIVRDYLLNNPELLLEMQGALEAKQKEEQRIASLSVIKESKDEIFNSKFDGIVGNPDGKTTIVEFYDYNCGYCKRAQQDMNWR